MSAAEVVKKGKAAGMTILPGLVHEVRRTAMSKKAAKKTSTPPKKVTAKAPVTVSKADFVRARAHLSPKEVVEDAKAARIKFGVQYVYNVRAYDKTGRKRKPAQATKPSAPTTKARATPRLAPPVPRPIYVALQSRQESIQRVRCTRSSGSAGPDRG